MPVSLSVTCPDLETARRIASAALRARLVACANIVPGVESHYWWQGTLERDSEVLLSFKTTPGHRDALAALIAAQHPYDLAAVSWSQDGAPQAVEAWIEAETKPPSGG